MLHALPGVAALAQPFPDWPAPDRGPGPRFEGAEPEPPGRTYRVPRRTPHVPWVEGPVVGVRRGNTKDPTVIFINSHTGVGMDILPPGRWSTVDLSEHLPPGADVKAIFLEGLLIITHVQSPETCNLTVTFKNLRDNLQAESYQGQSVETTIGGGERDIFASWVPVTDGLFRFYWKATTSGPYPQFCAYGINLSLQAYLR